MAGDQPQAQCVIAGEGSERARLDAEISRLNMGSKVKLVGFVPDTLSLINASDLFVLPSLAEPFGLVLLEAMALGIPVIATKAGGPVEIIRDGESGLLVPSSDAGALAEAIGKLAGDSGTAKRLGRRGLSRFHERFTADRMVDATLSVYLGL
jgi:glycosyltransferase involved in cell wall biosynthesis